MGRGVLAALFLGIGNFLPASALILVHAGILMRKVLPSSAMGYRVNPFAFQDLCGAPAQFSRAKAAKPAIPSMLVLHLHTTKKRHGQASKQVEKAI
jgi:hypothetical protein